jgi:hypothetical protein
MEVEGARLIDMLEAPYLSLDGTNGNEDLAVAFFAY